jgi:hypothetical protein
MAHIKALGAILEGLVNPPKEISKEPPVSCEECNPQNEASHQQEVGAGQIDLKCQGTGCKKKRTNNCSSE